MDIPNGTLMATSSRTLLLISHSPAQCDTSFPWPHIAPFPLLSYCSCVLLNTTVLYAVRFYQLDCESKLVCSVSTSQASFIQPWHEIQTDKVKFGFHQQKLLEFWLDLPILGKRGPRTIQ